MISALAFWAACALLGYTLVGYPAAIALWARIRPRPVRAGADTPDVSIVVVAHDEAERIAARLENLLTQDYPADRLQIVIASDGSTDATAEVARAFADPRFTVLAFEQRRGKAAVLNDALSVARGEIVVFADARQRFERETLRALVAPFADPKVGAVSGELCFEASPDTTSVGSGVGAYWRYEKLIRRAESSVDSCVGATGAIYAIRRALFVPIPATTILDDVLIPMTIVQAGYRTVFTPAARAYDRVARTAEQEFARKVRTIAGTFQLFARHRWLLDPRRNRLWLQTVSHKFLRLWGPFALAVALVTNALLLDAEPYRVTFAAQLLLYAAALLGSVRSGASRTRGVASAIAAAAYAFVVLQAATAVAFVRFVARTQPVTWTKARA